MEYFVLIAGVILFLSGIIGIIMYKSENKRNDCMGEAVIVSIEHRHARDGAYTWTDIVPTIEYRINGKKYRKKYFRQSVTEAIFNQSLRVGQKLTIVYSSNTPEFIRIKDFDKGESAYVPFVIIGGIIMAIGIYIISVL